MSSTPEKRVQELHLTLPPAPKPVAVYKTAVKFGNLLFVSGHGPLKADKTLITGRVGKDLNTEQGKEAARQTGLAILATIKEQLGSLDKVKKLLKTYGMVNCTDDFLQTIYDIAVTNRPTPSASVTNFAPTNSANFSRPAVRSEPTTTTFKSGSVWRSLTQARYPLSSPVFSGSRTACGSVSAAVA